MTTYSTVRARRVEHTRDSNITFIPSSHTYRLSNAPMRKMVSVTTIIKSAFAPFDADTVIKRMMSSRNWPSSKYFGRTVADIKREWETTGKEAREEGTYLHDQIERYINGEEVDCDRMSDDAYIAFEQFLDWDNSRGFTPYRAEWCIYDEELGVAGTIDAVMKSAEGEYVIIDWKRSKEIKMTNDFSYSTIPSLSHLQDCNFVKYSLQLNLYKHLLEKNYGIKISKLLLVCFHPSKETYEEYEALELGKEVTSLLKHVD